MLRKLFLYYLLFGGIFLFPICVQAETVYTDIAPGDWAWPYVQRLDALGLLYPFSESEFAGEQAITRFEYLQSLSSMLDYFEANSGRVSALVEMKQYSLQFSEELTELQQAVAVLEAKNQLQQIVIQDLEEQVAAKAQPQANAEQSTTLKEFQQSQQRLTQLETSVTRLQQDLEVKNDQLNRLYIVIALLGATSILK